MDLKEQYEKLLCYCYIKTRDRYIAEDIVQEAYLRFWKSYTYQDTGKELAYLYRIAKNLEAEEYDIRRIDRSTLLYLYLWSENTQSNL